jgi:transmembrane sensor
MQHDDECYALLSKYFARQCNATEQALVEEWRRENPVEYAQLFRVWTESRTIPPRFNKLRARSKLNQRLDALEAEGPSAPVSSEREVSPAPVRKIDFRPWHRVAASVAVLLVCLGLSWFYLRNIRQPEIAWVEKSTGKSQVGTFTLQDGSKVRLNADSKIRFAANFTEGTRREIYLEGEGFFEVSHNPRQPFLVHAQGVTTRVLGTAFLVSAYAQDSTCQVAVASGKVEVRQNEQVLANTLTPNRQVIFHKPSGQWQETDVNIPALLGWTDGKLVFQNASLEKVADRLERYYDVRVIFADPGIKNCHLTAEFESETLSNVLESISYTNNLTYTLKDSVVIISGNGCQ